MGEQRPAVVADEVEDDLLAGPPAATAVALQSADDLTAKDPDVVAVQAQGLVRQRPGQHLTQERLEAFDHPQAGRNVACLICPTGWPLLEIRAVALQGIGGDLMCWQADRPPGNSLGSCCHAADLPVEPLPALARFRVRARAACAPSQTIEITVRPRRGSRPVCSGCHNPAPGYDHLSQRRFEFVPLWGCMVVLLYCMPRVDCRTCGVRVEAVPW